MLVNMVDYRKLSFTAVSQSLSCSWDDRCILGFGKGIFMHDRRDSTKPLLFDRNMLPALFLIKQKKMYFLKLITSYNIVLCLIFKLLNNDSQ